MKIDQYLDIIGTLECIRNNDCEFSSVNFDSRKITSKDLFVAISGTLSDGHNYIDSAISKGAKIVVCQTLPQNINENVSYIKVNNSSKALGILASAIY